MKILKFNANRADAQRARAAGSVTAVLCVGALVGLVWLHAGDARWMPWADQLARPAALDVNDFLHTPAAGTSVPSAESVFGASPSATTADEPPPTF